MIIDRSFVCSIDARQDRVKSMLVAREYMNLSPYICAQRASTFETDGCINVGLGPQHVLQVGLHNEKMM